MPYTPLSDGSTLTAAHLLANVYDQVISQVTSGTRPSSPPEGQFIYETDTDLVQGYNGAWVPFGGLGAWTSYTPTLTQSGAVTKTVAYARSIKIGRLVIVAGTLAITGTGTANNAVTVSTPYTAATAGNLDCGVCHLFDASASLNYTGHTVLNSTSAFAFLDTTQGAAVLLGQTGTVFSAALASGDAFAFSAMYESAA